MSKPKILSETPISVAEVKKEIEKIKKRDTELSFRTGKTEEYTQLFEMTEKKADELIKKIESLEIPRLKKEHLIKLADIAPKTPEEVKLVLSGYSVTLTQENVKKISDTIAEIVG